MRRARCAAALATAAVAAAGCAASAPAAVTVQTIAGTGQPGTARAGIPAASAPLRDPGAVAVAGASVLIADTGNHRVWRVGADGQLVAIAGTGAAASSGDGGPATAAAVLAPSALDVTDDGRVLIAEPYRVRSVDVAGRIATIAGSGVPGDRGDGGPAALARFDGISAVAAWTDGSVLVADRVNRRVRRVGADGVVTTVAGTGRTGSSGDGGAATAADLVAPAALAVEADGSFAIADAGSGRVRRIEPGGRIVTVAGGGTSAATVGARAVDVALVPVGLAALPDGGLAIASAAQEDDGVAGALVIVSPSGVVTATVPVGACRRDALCTPTALAADDTALLAADAGIHAVSRIVTTAAAPPAAAGPPRSSAPAGLAIRGLVAQRKGMRLRIRFRAPAGAVRIDARVGRRWVTVRRERTRGGTTRLTMRLRGAARRAKRVRVTLRRAGRRATEQARVRR